ncbi:hypothetical protein B0H34DRAFT_722972 [Crassisporium funariophilum]|nr:hypothetical protein B0H34DRAFT_722972 [Crassisporium funariophilum]
MSFADLPNELLFKISEYIPFEFHDLSCLRLALTCRRLHELLMPQILDAQDRRFLCLIQTKEVILRDEEGIATPKQYSQRSRMSRESYLDIRFVVDINDQTFQCVHSFILRSKRLQKVVLEFSYKFSWRNSNAWMEWSEVSMEKIADLINSFVEKPGLELVICGRLIGRDDQGGPFELHFYSPTVSERLARTVPLVGVVTERLTKFLDMFRPAPAVMPMHFAHTSRVSLLDFKPSYSVAYREPKFCVRLAQRPQMTSLNLSCRTFFLASYLPLTIHTLNTAPIAKLELSNIILGPYSWSHIFSQLTLPCLTNLSIGNLTIAFLDLAAFLERHSLITDLDFQDSQPSGIVRLPLAPFLPALTTLAGKSSYLIPFLQDSASFPALQAVRLKPSTAVPSTSPYYQGNKCDAFYDLLAHRQSPRMVLSLDSLQACGLVPWLMCRLAKDSPSPLLPCVVRLCFLGGFDLSHAVLADIKSWHLLHSHLPLPALPLEPEDRTEDFTANILWMTCPEVEAIVVPDKVLLRP